MKGTRPLDNDEIRRVSTCFTGNPYEVRNRGLFMLGVSTSGRFETLIQCKHFIVHYFVYSAYVGYYNESVILLKNFGKLNHPAMGKPSTSRRHLNPQSQYTCRPDGAIFSRHLFYIDTAPTGLKISEHTLTKLRAIHVILDHPRFAAYSPKCDVHSDENINMPPLQGYIFFSNFSINMPPRWG